MAGTDHGEGSNTWALNGLLLSWLAWHGNGISAFMDYPNGVFFLHMLYLYVFAGSS